MHDGRKIKCEAEKMKDYQGENKAQGTKFRVENKAKGEIGKKEENANRHRKKG